MSNIYDLNSRDINLKTKQQVIPLESSDDPYLVVYEDVIHSIAVQTIKIIHHGTLDEIIFENKEFNRLTAKDRLIKAVFKVNKLIQLTKIK